ncbi:uncharacterized protein V6R79_015247 [Siganus canaliculatus]
MERSHIAVLQAVDGWTPPLQQQRQQQQQQAAPWKAHHTSTQHGAVTQQHQGAPTCNALHELYM